MPTFENCYIAGMEDGVSKRKGIVRVLVQVNQRGPAIPVAVPAKFVKLIHDVRNEEVPVTLITEGPTNAQRVVEVRLQPTPFSRTLDVLDAMDERGTLARSTMTYASGKSKVLKFVTRDGRIALVEKCRAGGVEIYVPLTGSDASLDDSLDAVDKFIRGPSTVNGYTAAGVAPTAPSSETTTDPTPGEEISREALANYAVALANGEEPTGDPAYWLGAIARALREPAVYRSDLRAFFQSAP